jgi:hypothetical protein
LWQSQTFCARKKDDLHSVKLVFVPDTKVFDKALNAVKFLGWLKKIGPAQNILGPVKGQGLSVTIGIILRLFASKVIKYVGNSC